MKTINVGFLQEYFSYDPKGFVVVKKHMYDQDYKVGDRLMGHKSKDGRVEYYIPCVQKTIRAHRLIFALVHGFFPERIDHINGDASDNRVENLRVCSQEQNTYNQKIRKDNTTGIKGLGFHSTSNLWRGRIKANGKVFVKRSNNKDIVIQWLKKMRPQLHGEFCRE